MLKWTALDLAIPKMACNRVWYSTLGTTHVHKRTGRKLPESAFLGVSVGMPAVVMSDLLANESQLCCPVVWFCRRTSLERTTSLPSRQNPVVNIWPSSKEKYNVLALWMSKVCAVAYLLPEQCFIPLFLLSPFHSTAQFTVHVRRKQVVALQSVRDTSHWLGVVEGGGRLTGEVSRGGTTLITPRWKYPCNCGFLGT